MIELAILLAFAKHARHMLLFAALVLPVAIAAGENATQPAPSNPEQRLRILALEGVRRQVAQLADWRRELEALNKMYPPKPGENEANSTAFSLRKGMEQGIPTVEASIKENQRKYGFTAAEINVAPDPGGAAISLLLGSWTVTPAEGSKLPQTVETWCFTKTHCVRLTDDGTRVVRLQKPSPKE